MPGHYCAVKGCNNNSKKVNIENCNPKITFHSFPKNAMVRKIWQAFCSEDSSWEPTVSARICSVHFAEEDFEMRFKSDLIQDDSVNRRRLTAQAIPSLHQTRHIGNNAENSSQVLQNNGHSPGNVTNDISEHTADLAIVNSALLKKDEIITLLRKNIVDMQQEIDNLKKFNNTLLQDKLKQQAYIAHLEKQNNLLKQEIEKEKSLNPMINTGELAKKLSPVLSENQINLILKRKVKVMWTSEEICKAFTLRYYSKNAYTYLRNEGFPLPSIKTLQSYAARINMRSGILHDIFKLMEIRGRDLSNTEKITVVMYDEMKVKALHEYDVHMDDILGPHNYVQVIMARGLYSNWKQVIFVKFDTNMTKTILEEVIQDLHQIHYNVVAFVSDCGGANQGTIRDLGVNVEKVYFPHPVTAEKVFYFPDGPHILKLIRNCMWQPYPY